MQLGVNFPGDYYGNDVAKSYDMFGYFDNQRQKQEAIKNQEINRQMALDELFRTQQKHPLEMRQMELGNLTREAQLPGIKADSDMRARDRDVRAGIPIDVETKQALLKATTEMSNNEWTQTQNAIKQLMVSESPSQRQVGEMLYNMMPDMVKQRDLYANKQAIEEAKAQARKDAAEETTRRQLAVVRARGEQTRQALAAQKDPKTYQEAAVKFRNMADATDDEAVRNELLAKANEFERAAIALAQARSAGQIDVGAATGMPTKEVSPQLGGGSKPGSSKDNPIVLK